MELMLQDFRHAARSLARSRGFVAVTVLSLALGIGANAAVFTIGNGLLLKPLQVPEPQQLVRAHYGDHSPFSFADYADLRDQTATVLSLMASQGARVAVGTGEAARDAGAEITTANYFTTLGLTPQAGRFYRADEGSPTSGDLVAVLSDRAARRDFATPEAAIGRQFVVNGTSYTVIGVAPASFKGALFGFGPDAWLPISAGPRILGTNLTRHQVGGGLYAVGRLAAGVTVDQARAALSLAAQRLSAAYPEVHRNGFQINVARARGVPQEVWVQLAAMVAGALLLSAFVLLIACSNVVNVALARATARRREVAVRSALGAGRWRLIRQMASESAIIAVLAAGVGLFAASWAAQIAVGAIPPASPLSAIELAPDARVLAFTAVATMAVVFACGVLPAMRGTKDSLIDSIREGAPTGDRRGARLRATLVGVQVALCTVLLVGSGLFVRSLGKANAMRTGFEPEHVLDIALDARMMGLDSTRGRQLYGDILARASAIPGVEVATIANLVPLSFDNNGMSFSIEGRTTPQGQESPEARFNITGPGYLKTLGIPLLRGREFTDADDGRAPLVAIINETFAERYWPGEDAIGKQFGRTPWGTPATVIGVAKDSKYTTLGEETPPFMYLPFAQRYSPGMVLQVRTRGDPASLAAVVRRELRAIAPTLPLNARPLADEIQVAVLPARIGAAVLGLFGALALALALGGVYGVAAYTVAQRTREIGIRSALGGTAATIIVHVLTGSLRAVIAGLAVGLLLAFGAGQGMASFLYGVSSTDLLTFTAVPTLLAGAAVLACLVPARRAARVEPIVALRID